MAESRTTILTRLLAEISAIFDKSVGSFFYDAEMPVAIEAERVYSQLDENLNQAFVRTATGTRLDLKGEDYNVSKNAATKASGHVTITGVAGASIVIGQKVASDLNEYEVTENKTIATGQTTMSVAVQCSVAGESGNVIAGAINKFPVTISGLSSVNNPYGHDTTPQEFSNGYDIEEEEAFRERIFEAIREPKTSGNKYHYKFWAKEVEGVGDARVIPLWDGAGTVKVVICDTDYRAADSTLTDAVKAYIDPGSGTGEGQAPIGANCTVSSGEEKNIQVRANVSLASGANINTVKARISVAIADYLKTIALTESKVSFGFIGNVIYDDSEVVDYENLEIRKSSTGTWQSNAIDMLDTELPVHDAADLTLNIL